jgi:hypothetical protein
MPKLLVVCHDSGGAELLSCFLKFKKLKFDYFLKGPAIKIFEKNIGKKFINFKEHKLNKKILDSSLVLTGTSWSSTLEKKTIKFCKSKKIKVISYIDHWVNYKERFFYKNNFYLPDVLWTHDKISKQIAQKEFNIPIINKKNYYFKKIRNDFLHIAKKNKKIKIYKFLFLSEPIKKHKPKLGFDEYICLERFLDFVCKLNNKFKILIRMHPYESLNKYDKILRLSRYKKLNIYISKNTNLVEDIFYSINIVGINSMAMAVAIMLNNDKVFCCLDPKKYLCDLPYKKIKYIII